LMCSRSPSMSWRRQSSCAASRDRGRSTAL
jgi:hypothetical protein